MQREAFRTLVAHPVVLELGQLVFESPQRREIHLSVESSCGQLSSRTFQEVLDIPGAVEDRNDRDRSALGVVDDEV
jgi:hypothetical protein